MTQLAVRSLRVRLSSSWGERLVLISFPVFIVLVACLSQPVFADDEQRPEWTADSYVRYPFPVFVDDINRYPGSAPPAGTVNRHGEIEYIGDGVFGVHWFVAANNATWHFVTAGDPSKDTVLLICTQY